MRPRFLSPASIPLLFCLAGLFPCSAQRSGVSSIPAIALGFGSRTFNESVPPAGSTNLLAIAAGSSFSLALRSDRTVFGWGENSVGQASPPPGLSGITAIAAGYAHGLAVRANGTVVGWGANSSLQTNPPPGLSGVIAVAAGDFHSLALLNNGTVVGWGDNSYKQANPPPGLSGVVAVAAGANHSLALRSDGSVVAWGQNAFGQTNVPFNLGPVIGIAAGEAHSVALRADGIVVAWGYNGSGQTSVPAGLIDVVEIAAGRSHNLARKRNGTVVCWGWNDFGQCTPPIGTSNVVALAGGNTHSLALRLDSPVIIAHPQGLTVTSGSSATFTVNARGSGPLTYQWRKNGATLAGATNTTYSIATTQPSDAANYSVVVSNPVGSVTSSNATLVVATPPAITTHPTSQTVPEGSTVVFSVTATGTPPLAYQWYGNNTLIFGATNASFTINNVQSGHAGTFRVVVTNLAGSVTSSNAVLTVGSAPVITSQPTNQTVLAGSSATFSVSANGATAYQWLKDGVPIASASASTYSINAVQASDAGAYSVRVANNAGTNTSSAATLTVVSSASLRLLTPVRLPNGRVRLTIANADGTPIQQVRVDRIQVRVSSDPAAPLATWTILTDVKTLSGGRVTIEDSGSAGVTLRFYRTVETP